MPKKVDDGKIALCLSGGGLRATMFHLGVIRALRAAERGGERAIESVSEIYSVSGGSILAAHMMANWDTYSGRDEAEFAKMQEAMFDFADLNLRDRVLRRAITQRLGLIIPALWPSDLAPEWVMSLKTSRRAHWLKAQYRSLIGTKTLADCARQFPRMPQYFILATSFRSAELCAFTNQGFEIERRDGSLMCGPASDIALVDAVAASSAFPPLFPPIAFPRTIIDAGTVNSNSGSILLSDGGLYDNLGVEKFQARRGRTPSATPERLLISDGGAAFKNDDIASFSGVFGRNMRASDVLMDRVARSTETRLHGDDSIEDILVSIRSNDGFESLGTAFGMVRTDLDRFDSALCTALADWGEAIARQRLAAHGWTLAAPSRIGFTAKDEERKALLANASARKLRSLFSFRRDWGWTSAFMAAVAAMVTVFVVTPISAINYMISEAKIAAAEEGEYKATKQEEKYQKLEESYADTLVKIERTTNLVDAQRLAQETRTRLHVRKEEAQASFEQRRPDSVATGRSGAREFEDKSLRIAPGNQPVYIQFYGFSREEIASLNKRLKAAGWNVQSNSGERIATAKNMHQVRFGGNNKEVAQALADAINNSAIRTNADIEVKSVPIVGPKNLEVWIGQ